MVPVTEPGTGSGTNAWYRFRYRISLLVPVPVPVPVRNSVPVSPNTDQVFIVFQLYIYFLSYQASLCLIPTEK